MPFPTDYPERVYAGVLGKIIGVYLGRPIEGWTYERITRELGEIKGYLHKRLGVPLIVTDDDLTGTFTFIRSLENYGFSDRLTTAQIGHTWLNTIIENKTILWWGGMGNSTEHTAYLRLKAGIDAPQSGSMAMNGQIVAEQIGAQIFIDGWGMICPGDPEMAADLAGRAARVSHDGEAVYAAQVIAAMEALAFVENDLDVLLDTAVSLIPPESIIARMIGDIREWHAAEVGRLRQAADQHSAEAGWRGAGPDQHPDGTLPRAAESKQRSADLDWRTARRRLADAYGYTKYGGNVHVVPNHGLIILALLYGKGDFHRSLSIVNTAGWDTDCNSGNLGCLLGIRNGLTGLGGEPGGPVEVENGPSELGEGSGRPVELENAPGGSGGPDWRGPVGDRLYLPTAEGGRTITDAVTEAFHLVNTARALRGLDMLAPKNGARFHFELPGSVQGFRAVVEDGMKEPAIRTENVTGHSQAGRRSLAIHLPALAPAQTVRVETATFVPSLEEYEYFASGSYPLLASPTLYPGQVLRAGVSAAINNPGPIEVRLMVRRYDEFDRHVSISDQKTVMMPGNNETLAWRVPDTGGYPIAWTGLLVQGSGASTVHLDYLTWDGTPAFRLVRPYDPNSQGLHPVMWKRAWVNGLDSGDGTFEWDHWPEPFRLVQNTGRGLLMMGTRAWCDYRVEAAVIPHMCRAGGVAVRVQGLRRYYALRLDGDNVQLIRAFEGRDEVLAAQPGGWEMGQAVRLTLAVGGNRLVGTVDDKIVLEAADPEAKYAGGAMALFVEEGRLGCEWIEIGP